MVFINGELEGGDGFVLWINYILISIDSQIFHISPCTLHINTNLIFIAKVSTHKCLFESVVEIAFKNIFYLKIHQNNVFLFLKNNF